MPAVKAIANRRRPFTLASNKATPIIISQEALALSLPLAQPTTLLWVFTYAGVILSIIVQGLTIGPLLKRLGVSVAE
jgi:hypothetical protein